MIRIIGLGSPFGDDQVGWRVVESLRGRLPDTIDLVALDRPGATLINWMQRVEHLVLIDAVCSGAEPGSLFRLRPAELPEERSHYSSHDLALRDTLRLAESLDCRPGLVDIYAIELDRNQGEGLSPAAEAAVRVLSSRIVKDLRGSGSSTR